MRPAAGSGLSSERVRQLEDRALRRLAQDDAVSALRDAAVATASQRLPSAR